MVSPPGHPAPGDRLICLGQFELELLILLERNPLLVAPPLPVRAWQVDGLLFVSLSAYFHAK